MAENIPLSHIPLGKRVVIASVGDNERLKTLGFRADTEIIPIHTAAGGDPRAYYVVGAVIAIRQGEADNIGVREKSDNIEKTENISVENKRESIEKTDKIAAARKKTKRTSESKNLYKRGEADD